MEDRETSRMHKYGESKTTRIMMATVTHVTSGLGLRKFQADGFLLTRVYMWLDSDPTYTQFLLTTICCFCVTPPLCVKKKYKPVFSIKNIPLTQHIIGY